MSSPTTRDMRYLILSDVHANIEALEAVQQAVASEQVDNTVFLGDIVGYGAEPNQAIERLRQLQPTAVVRGNHDKVIGGIEEPVHFQKLARASAMWSRRQITPENSSYLKQMPQGPVVLEGGDVTLSHGSPHDEDFYILRDSDARRVLLAARSWITFFGHTHLPVIYAMQAGFSAHYPDADVFSYPLSAGARYLINPGSVGQPRDLNPKASFALLDTKASAISIRRVEYDVRTTQKKIRQSGLPSWHAERLASGR